MRRLAYPGGMRIFRLPPLALGIAVAAFAFVLAGSADADPVFPGSSNVGLEPPPGMRVLAEANGFRNGNATISIAELLPGNFNGTADYKKLLQQPLRKASVRAFPLPGAPHAYLVEGVQQMGPSGEREWTLIADFKDEAVFVSASAPDGDPSLTEAMVERAFKTIVMHKLPDLAAEMAALPYVVGDMAGLRPDVVVDRTLQLTDGFMAVDLTAKQPHVYVVPIAGPKPGVALEDFAKGLIRGADASAKLLGTQHVTVAGVDWVRSDALGAESRLGKPATLVELVRAWPGGGVLRVRGELAGDAPDPAFAARVQTLALSVRPR